MKKKKKKKKRERKTERIHPFAVITVLCPTNGSGAVPASASPANDRTPRRETWSAYLQAGECMAPIHTSGSPTFS